MRRSNADRTASTKGLLTTTARRLFAEQGYTSTTLAAVARRAGLSTGAVYHHWSGKEELLADVVHDIYRDLAGTIDATAGSDGPADRLIDAGRAFLAMCSDAATARLLLIDAPAALGQQRWSEIDEAWWLSATRRAVDAARGEATTAEQSRHTALVLLGALTYLGRDVAVRGGGPAGAAVAYESLVRALLAGQ